MLKRHQSGISTIEWNTWVQISTHEAAILATCLMEGEHKAFDSATGSGKRIWKEDLKVDEGASGMRPKMQHAETML